MEEKTKIQIPCIFIQFQVDLLIQNNPLIYFSVRQMLEQVQEECETLSADSGQYSEATISTPTTFWVFENNPRNFQPRPLPVDTHHSLFQLEDYYLLQPLCLYVESATCRTQSTSSSLAQCTTPSDESEHGGQSRLNNRILFLKVIFDFKALWLWSICWIFQ